MYAWSTIDFEFDSTEARDNAIFDGDYVAENNLPLGLDVWRDKIFITLPKWKIGIPVTLATVPRHSKKRNPKLKPYPNWQWHQSGDFFTLIVKIMSKNLLRDFILCMLLSLIIVFTIHIL